MKAFVCECCGSRGLRIQNGYAICDYCDTKFLLTTESSSPESMSNVAFSTEKNSTPSSISLSDDIEMLLRKCRTNPKNARKYANLILDIDPDNSEALQYL